MEGVQYVTDSNNERVAVQIDLKKYGDLWEDFYDGFLAELANDEEPISIEEAGRILKKKGLLDEIPS